MRFLLCLLFLFLFVGCNTTAPSSVATEEPTPAVDTLKIGVLVPLTPPGSVSGGEAMRDAFKIAEQEINEMGGVLGQPIELLIEDTEGLAERGTTAMQKLAEEGVMGVVGLYHSAVGLTAIEIAHQNKIPMVVTEAWNDNITSKQYPEIFRIAPLASEVAAIDAEFIVSLGAEYVVLVTESTSYGIPIAIETDNQLTANNIRSYTYFDDIGTDDFSSTILDIKRGPTPDVILVLLTGETSFAFQQQAAEAGIGPQDVLMICNQAATDSDAFWEAVPDGKLCVYRRIGLPLAQYTPQTVAFAETYIKTTGKVAPESFAMEAYDSLKLLAQAINDANSTDSTDIIEALETIQYDGALGKITFTYGSHNPLPNGVQAKWWHQFPNPAITMVQYTETGQQASQVTIVYPPQYQTGAVIRPVSVDQP